MKKKKTETVKKPSSNELQSMDAIYAKANESWTRAMTLMLAEQTKDSGQSEQILELILSSSGDINYIHNTGIN